MGRRDRHGRGVRGPLIPAEHPAATSRSEAFDDEVLDAFERLLPRWGTQLRAVDLVVVEMPDVERLGAAADPAADPVPLAYAEPAGANRPARIVVHRHPVLRRSRDRTERVALLEDLMVEQVADLLGLTPEQVDPRWDVDDD